MHLLLINSGMTVNCLFCTVGDTPRGSLGEFPSTSDHSLADKEELLEGEDTAQPNGEVPHGESPTEIINCQGVRFLQTDLQKDGRMTPYGLPCVCRVTKYLASCIDCSKRKQPDKSIHIGLKLVTTVMECGSSLLETAPSVLHVVKDSLCKNLFAVSASLCTPASDMYLCSSTQAHTHAQREGGRSERE